MDADTGIAYKLLRVKKGRLFPLFVNTRIETPVAVWLYAGAGVKVETGRTPKVQSSIGLLSWRPGWHLAKTPEANHMVMTPNRVWCEVEYDKVGAYEYKTSPRQTEPWIICKRMKIIRTLNAEQVEHLLLWRNA